MLFCLQEVVARIPHVSQYTYDAQHHLWCEVTFKVCPHTKTDDLYQFLHCTFLWSLCCFCCYYSHYWLCVTFNDYCKV